MNKVEKLTLLTAWLGEPLKTLEPIVGVCLLSPQKGLAGIPDLPENPTDLQNHWSFQFFYFLGYGQLALDQNESHSNSKSEIREFCEKSLLAFRRANDLAGGLLDLGVEPIAAHLDDVAILLEKCVPGRVQELLGETKLKYALIADRVSIANAVQGHLNNEELREIFELKMKLPFTFRSALLGALTHVGSTQMLHIMLYEQSEIWGPSDQMNPIKGQLVVSKTNEADSQWAVDRVS